MAKARSRSKTIQRLSVRNVGPIRSADVEFGDLTAFVGPQATGKSIFLQILKLVLDAPSIRRELRRFNIEWRTPGDFFRLYFGEGLSELWSSDSSLKVDEHDVDLRDLSKNVGGPTRGEEMFFIPAQRVMSLKDGLTRPFQEYRAGDPFTLRSFSESLHSLVQNEFGHVSALFPKANRLDKSLRDPIAEHVFAGFGLNVETESLQKRIVLNGREGTPPLPYLVWSAGQREFVPLLLGLYWLIPPARTPRRGALTWVAIEELEMGLHPKAIAAAMSLVLELLHRNYRVCLSTHSPAVLDVLWGVRFAAENGGTAGDVVDMLGLKRSQASLRLAEAALLKRYRTSFFTRRGEVKDISALDPASPDAEESGWGGLTEFSGRVGEVISRIANRAEWSPAKS